MTCIENISTVQLGRFVADHVKMREEETKRVVEVIDPIIRDLGSRLADGAPFTGQPHYGGSYYKNMKVRHADEFDIQFELKPKAFLKNPQQQRDTRPRTYAFCMDGNSINEETMKTVNPTSLRAQLLQTYTSRTQPIHLASGQCTFVTAPRVGDGSVHVQVQDIEFQGDLISFLAQKKFKQLIEDYVDSNTRSNGWDRRVKSVSIKPEYHGPSITLAVKLNIPGVQVEEVSLDLMVALPVQITPPFGEWGWPRHATKTWLSWNKISAIQSKTMNVVVKKPYYWELVDSELYKEIFAGIDMDGGCRKESLRLLKTMRDKFWNKPRDWAILKSYMLENLLLWECEKHPSSGDWAPGQKAERFKGLMRSLIGYLGSNHLPHYFNPRVNLLTCRSSQEIREQHKTLEAFMKEPASYLD